MTIFDEVLPPSLGEGSYGPPDKVRSFCFDPWEDRLSASMIALGNWLDPAVSRDLVGKDMVELLKNEIPKQDPHPEIETRLKHENGKWKGMSAVQKAVRRNSPFSGFRAAHAMHIDGQDSGLWRRLAVIALEDMGLADPILAAAVMTLAGSKPLRKTVGERQALFWAVEQMGLAPKSRDLCDTIGLGWMDGVLNDEANKIVDDDLPDLVQRVGAVDLPWKERMIAYWRLNGLPADLFPEGPKPPKSFRISAVEQLKMPPIIEYLLERSAPVIGVGFNIPMPFIWQLMCASDWISSGSDPFEINDEEVIVGGVLSSTYDKHVWEGKRAFKYFRKACQPVREWLDEHPDLHEDALAIAVFYVEGQVLRPHVWFEKAEDVYIDTLRYQVLDHGFADFKEGMEFYGIVSKNLDDLHNARRVVTGTD